MLLHCWCVDGEEVPVLSPSSPACNRGIGYRIFADSMKCRMGMECRMPLSRQKFRMNLRFSFSLQKILVITFKSIRTMYVLPSSLCSVGSQLFGFRKPDAITSYVVIANMNLMRAFAWLCLCVMYLSVCWYKFRLINIWYINCCLSVDADSIIAKPTST